MHTTVLSLRALNRATLARQMLLARATVSAAVAVERLAGLQAQLPRPPFVGLWSRVEGFRREHLVEAVARREVARGTLMRATLHLVSRADFLPFRAALQPMFAAAAAKWARERLAGVDLAELLAEARARFERGPCTFDDIRAHLRTRFPDAHDRAMGYVVRLLLPTIQVPEAGAAWAYPAQADFALAESWLGTRMPTHGTPASMVIRYLAAFGPATVRDLQVWSGLSALKEVVSGMSGGLRRFRDEDGRELFDLPDAPRPDPSVDAPVRFLPEYDNLLIGYADRTRIVPRDHAHALASKNLFVPATCLVDGTMAATWRAARARGVATLTITPVAKLSKRATGDLVEEGERLARFVDADAARHVVTVGR